MEKALLGTVGKVRRFYLTHFKRSEVERRLAMRRGECSKCGYCCKIVFRCPHLGPDNLCGIYDHRYEQCRAFPIDPRDLAELPDECGFRFIGFGPRKVVESKAS